MSETQYGRGDESPSSPFLNDQRLKIIGIAASGLFTLAVVGFLGVILYTQVNPDRFVNIIHPQFIDAFFVVLRIVAISSVLSVTGGMLVGLGRISETLPTRGIAKGYIEFFRGTPLLFQLIVIYSGIPAFWPPGQFPIANFSVPAAIIGLTLNHSAYIGEAIRGGVEAVPDGQMEAARSLGMSYAQAMREVVLPQAWRNALAAIGNDQVILVKDTSLLSVLAVPEIISTVQNINSATFDIWTPILWAAILYLAITIPLGKFVRYLEARADPTGGPR
ncbi:amino acid ABC transporter permease [Halobacteriales archaeon QH_7_66_36]|nr:MAG: amino acid ABC transporter permease [Halobacteriales archaeon QH_7_66_36]